jgi:DNA polymerase-1
MKPNGKVVLVDGYSQIYRSFFAIPGLTNPAGEPVNALYGMARFLLALDRDWEHEFGSVVLDKGIPHKRLELLPEYKAQRPEMPADLRTQIPAIRQWIEAAGWPLLEKDGCEADDLIGAIVSHRQGRPTYIVSQDKDLGQLVNDEVQQLVPGSKGKLDLITAADIEAKFGVPPAAIRDFIALVGDASDNVPGVPGIGPKTAASLIGQFGDIDTMLQQVDRIEREPLRHKIRDAAELLERNQQLVSLDCELPDDWQGIEGLRRQPPQWSRLRELAEMNGFKSLVGTLQEMQQADRSPTLF